MVPGSNRGVPTAAPLLELHSPPPSQPPSQPPSPLAADAHASFAVGEQRRYADGPCIFVLPKMARYFACHGLYIDGDLVGSELISLQEACKVGGVNNQNWACWCSRSSRYCL